MGNESSKTTFVIGAGASHEFGLPVGSTLKAKISNKLNIIYDGRQRKYISGDLGIMNLFEKISTYDSEYDQAGSHFQNQGWIIRDNMVLAPSIDNFLHTHRNNKALVLAGKIAIAKSIMEAERDSLIFSKRDKYGRVLSYNSALSDTWLGKFFTIMIAERDFEAFLVAVKNVTFISFNYDRCIHEFFCRAAKQYFLLDDEQVNELLEILTVVYTYGTIGKYSWNNGDSNFGKIEIHEGLLRSAQAIQTFTEGVGGKENDKINKAIVEADNVIFMGFGFLKLNMEYLFQDKRYMSKDVLATAKGLSSSSIEYQKEVLKKVFFANQTDLFILKHLKIMDKTCANLMHEFNAYLSG